jgi:transcriptional regulator with XRE-family HTH domain
LNLEEPPKFALARHNESRSMFRETLQSEFDARRSKNGRYSLRAFARLLSADHSTVSQILRGTRTAPATKIRAWSVKLGLSREEAAAAIIAEQSRDPATARRQRQVDNWTAEALSITTEPVHWEMLRLVRQPNCRNDSIWIAGRLGVSVDAVNVAFSRMLRLGLIGTTPQGRWKDLTGLSRLTEREFRTLALAKVREKAAE